MLVTNYLVFVAQQGFALLSETKNLNYYYTVILSTAYIAHTFLKFL